MSDLGVLDSISNYDPPVVFKIRKALEASVEKKFKTDINGGGTMLDGSCADFGFVLNNKTYSVIIREEEEVTD